MQRFRYARFVRLALGFARKFTIFAYIGFMLTNIVFAEENGVIVGTNAGYGVVVMQTDFDLAKASGELLSGGMNYGAGIVGYKHFFTPHFGMRYYANLSALRALNATALMQTNTSKQQITLLNYGANADFLWNFVANERFDFGIFVGLGIGGDTILGVDLDNYLQDFLETLPNRNLELRKTNFNAWLNVGIRANLSKHRAKYHDIEIFARLPFLRDGLLDKSFDTNAFRIKTTINNSYNIGIRYRVSF